MVIRQIAPGVTVIEEGEIGVEISIPHPDPCWVVEMRDGRVIGSRESLLVFSSDEKAAAFITTASAKKALNDDCVPRQYPWNEVVDQFAGQFEAATLDHRGVAGCYRSIPLQKELSWGGGSDQAKSAGPSQ